MKVRQLAISLGASYLGFPTHLGFLRGFVEAGWVPAAIAGSSSGALVAGLYAAGLSLTEIESIFTQRDLKRHFRERTFPLRALATFLFRPGFPAVLKGDRLYRLLKDVVGDRRIEDCATAKLCLAVSNLRTNRVELRTDGPLVETILASCALPGFLAPRVLDGELLWDGGLGSVVPVEQWIDDPSITHVATHALLHDDVAEARTRPERHNFTSAMLAGHQLAADELLYWKLELLRRAGKEVAAIETVTPRPRLGFPMSLPAPKPWPDHARDLIAAGEASAVRGLRMFSGGEMQAASC